MLNLERDKKNKKKTTHKDIITTLLRDNWPASSAHLQIEQSYPGREDKLKNLQEIVFFCLFVLKRKRLCSQESAAVVAS